MNIYPRMQVKVEIPEYLTVKHYLGFQYSTDITVDRDVIINTISIMTGYSVDDIREWNIEGVIQVYKALGEVIANTNPIFQPIVEVEGVLYGYQPASKMKLGEYIDLDNLSKDIQKNLSDIVAILYRPIENHKLKSLEFKVKNTWKYIYSNQPENLFKYYTVEKYNSDNRKIKAPEMNDFPAALALGALSFFLLSGAQSLKSSQTFSHPNHKLRREMMMKNLENQFLNTMGGFTAFTNYHKVQSYKSQEISHCLI
jgi:hypothetical protein